MSNFAKQFDDAVERKAQKVAEETQRWADIHRQVEDALFDSLKDVYGAPSTAKRALAKNVAASVVTSYALSIKETMRDYLSKEFDTPIVGDIPDSGVLLVIDQVMNLEQVAEEFRESYEKAAKDNWRKRNYGTV